MKKIRTLFKAIWKKAGLKNWIFFLVGVLVSSILTVGIVRLDQHATVDWDVTLKFVGAIATAIGVILVGIWGIYTTIHRRSLVARAELAHKCQVWSDSQGEVLRLFVELGNPSESLMQPGDGMTIVQIPPSADIDTTEYAYDAWVTIAALRHAVEYEELRIEPKETEVFVHDVRVPTGTRFIQIHSWMLCEPAASIDPGSDGATKRHPGSPRGR